MSRESIANGFVVAIMLGMSVVGGAAERPRIGELELSIRRASEAGKFSQVQALHKEAAEYCAEALDYACAVKHYELLLAGRPGRRERVGYFLQLGKMREALQDYSGAIAAYQDALHDQPRDYQATIALARAYDKIDLSGRAVEYYRKGAALAPQDAKPLLLLADVYMRIGYLSKAIESYQNALRLSPSADAYLGMVDCFVRQDDLAGAARTLDEGKALLSIAEYDARRGDINQRLGDGPGAAEAWELALSHDARRDDVRLKLVLLYDRLHRRAEADRHLQVLLAQFPRSPLVHFVRAWILYGRGDRQGSRREALAVQSLAPTEGVQHYNERLLALINK